MIRLQKVETSWSENCEAPFDWDSVMDVGSGDYYLSGVYCILVCETTHILFMGWTRHIGKCSVNVSVPLVCTMCKYSSVKLFDRGSV